MCLKPHAARWVTLFENIFIELRQHGTDMVRYTRHPNSSGRSSPLFHPPVQLTRNQLTRNVTTVDTNTMNCGRRERQKSAPYTYFELWEDGRCVQSIWSSISIITMAEDGTTREQQQEYAEEHNKRSSQLNLPVSQPSGQSLLFRRGRSRSVSWQSVWGLKQTDGTEVGLSPSISNFPCQSFHRCFVLIYHHHCCSQELIQWAHLRPLCWGIQHFPLLLLSYYLPLRILEEC